MRFVFERIANREAHTQSAPHPPFPRAKRALGAKRSSCTRQRRVERACERNPPQGAATFCAGAPKETQNKLAVPEDTPLLELSKDRSVRGGIVPTRRNDEERRTRGERSSPRQANQAAPLTPPRAPSEPPASIAGTRLSPRPDPRSIRHNAPLRRARERNTPVGSIPHRAGLWLPGSSDDGDAIPGGVQGEERRGLDDASRRLR